MSFIRIPKKTTKSASLPKRRSRKKPEWDDTKNDLSVYKASPEEVMRRKMAHQSKNVDLVQADKLTKKISKARSRDRAHGSAKKKQLPLLREMLYDQNQLRDVLAKSDKAMAVVRDLFGDDPKRYRGLPNVTVAPNQSALDGSLPTGTTIEGPSKLDVLSDTIMDRSALNEVNGHDSETEDEESESIQYKPLLDFRRFRNFLEAEQEQAEREDQVNKAKDAQALAKRLEAEMAQLGLVTPDTAVGQAVNSPHDGSYIEEKTPAQTPRAKAMNDTEKCQRARSRLTQLVSERPPDETSIGDNKPNSQNVSSTNYNMDDLKKVLEGLEGNLAAYEHQTGRTHQTTRTRPENFSGYTMSLVNAVSKLTVYLKESEARLRAECTLREQLTEDVEQLNAVIDTMTTDLMSIQEDYTNLQGEFYKQKLSSQQELHSLKAALISYGIPLNLKPQNISHKNRQDLPLQHASVRQEEGKQIVQPEPKVAEDPRNTQVPFFQPTQQRMENEKQPVVQPHQMSQAQQMVDASQQMQMFVQQMLMAQSMGFPLSTGSSEKNFASLQNITEDTVSLEQHPLSSSLTSQGTVRTVSSAGRPVQDLPPEPNQILAATLLSPPRQSNSPRTQDKEMPQQMVSQHKVLGPAGQSQQQMVHPHPQINQHHHGSNAFQQSLRTSPGQFRPLPLDSESNPDITNRQHAAGHPAPLYFNHQAQASQQRQGLGQAEAVTRSQADKDAQSRSQMVSHSLLALRQEQQRTSPLNVESIGSALGGDDGAAERVETNRDLLAKQIEQLNKQHAEAESKLEKLLMQQYKAVKDISQDDRVSPSISPIPGGSESDTGGTVVSDLSSAQAAGIRKQKVTQGNYSKSGSRGITIALPQMDMLNWSDTSTPTLSTSRTQSRFNEDSPVPVLAVSPGDDTQTPYKDRHKVNPNSAFFALATHVNS